MQLVADTPAFACVDKPALWLSVPSRLGEGDARPCVGRWLEDHLRVRLWPVHRLDLEVTGLLLFAKSEAAHKAASGWFERREVVKTYEALTRAEVASAAMAVTPLDELPPGSSFTWRGRMLRGKKRAYLSPSGKESETRALHLGEVHLHGLAANHWRLSPHTGRAHQLRFDLARHGQPILGDALYGSTAALPEAAGIALRCVELDFTGCPGYAAFALPERLQVPGLL